MPPKRYTIDDCKRFAETKGGKCLSTKYINNSTKLQWECSEGHTWWAHWNNIKDSGTWCYYCHGNVKLTIEECRKYAEEKDGKCLSETYENLNQYMDWECKEGHQWSVAFAGMRSLNQWCPYCSGRMNNNLQVCQEYAAKYFGKCLSEEYMNNKTYMDWECKKGHQWKARFDWMKHDNSWCPYCSSCRSEKIARETLETLMDKPFPKCRPDWLGGLELDGYCEEEKLAMEYQGRQHYEYNAHFHRTETAFKEQQERDARKKEILKERGIDLLEIPYTYNYLNEKELDDYIEREVQFILAARGEYTESEQIKILKITSDSIKYLDKKSKKVLYKPYS